MFIENLSKREKQLALITLLIVSVAIIYVILIAPLSAGWRNLNKQIQSKVDILEKDYKILANQQMLASEYDKLSKHAKSPGSEEQAVANTLTFIENVSRNDSCLIVNIKPAGITNAGSYKEMLIDVSAEATMEQFSKFLYDVENPRDNLINVKRFTISAKSGQTGTLKGVFLISKILLD